MRPGRYAATAAWYPCPSRVQLPLGGGRWVDGWMIVGPHPSWMAAGVEILLVKGIVRHPRKNEGERAGGRKKRWARMCEARTGERARERKEKQSWVRTWLLLRDAKPFWELKHSPAGGGPAKSSGPVGLPPAGDAA